VEYVVKSTDDRRRLSVSEWGKRTGTPVFMLHGTPGSRLGVAPRPSLLYQLGVRLIAYDRPGYGGSDRDLGRSVGDAAADVKRIADYLDIKEFAVVGRSGGGPHALACAALLPERVTRAAALVSLAPKGEPRGMGENWFEGMSEGNRDEYRRASTGIDNIAKGLTDRSDTIRKNPAAMISQLLEEVQHADLQVISDAGIRRILRKNYQEALTNSGDGWIDDAMAFSRDWGFDVADITVPVLLWHGEDDVFSPVQHSLWLNEHIRNATLRLEPGKAHFDAVSVLPDLLPWLKQPRSRLRPSSVTMSAVRARG
jgi:pimeloyl-ACP methyl ester carboxylesterase